MSFGIQQNDGKGSTSISKILFCCLIPVFPIVILPGKKETKKNRKKT